MFLPLTKSIASCLDRSSALKVARLPPDEETLRRRGTLEAKERVGQLTVDERTELAVTVVALEFLADLQLEARGVLRRPKASHKSARAG